jgi:hypothetical protein
MQRRIYTLILVLTGGFFATTARAQTQTLFGGDIESSGFGGPTTALTWVNGDPELLVGGGGAWTINRTFALGLAGYGLATAHNLETAQDSERQRLEGGYGGVTFEYMHRPDRLVHVSVGTLLGAGGFAIVEGSRFDDSDDQNSIDETAVFVAEPELGLSVNLFQFLQARVAGSYRFVVGSTLDGFGDGDLSGPAASFGLRFGRF